MRENKKNAGLAVNAVAGTHVVLLGLDLDEAKRTDCLGFAIQREDHTEDERYWMSGMKTFEATDPGLGPGGSVSSRQHPFQSFQWSDYSAKPEHDYTYTVIPLYGTPGSLKEGDSVSVRIKTEVEFGVPHSVFFNRGGVASQEYTRRFQDKTPEELDGKQKEGAYRWLSRGLLEALETFIRRASGPQYGLYGAMYEFQWPDVLHVINDVSQLGADVHVIFDAIPSPTGPVDKNKAQIDAAKIDNLCIPRTNGKIMHNKFFVLTKDGSPISVWTGSTNITLNGIFGHLNCGHIIEDADVAAAYLSYWNELNEDPESKNEKEWMAANNPAPPTLIGDKVIPIFSPRKGLNVLDWYGEVAGDVEEPNKAKPLFMTFAFGMHKDFQKVYERNDGVLRFALMEKEGNGVGLKQGKIDIRRIRSLPNVVVAVGHYIPENSFDRWLKENRQIKDKANVIWVHTKFMLVDPLGDNPIVITGSANFSEPSTDANNENMIVIRGDKRVADIYLGEFMRVYSHHAFREAMAIAKENGEEKWNPSYLTSDDTWQKDYFKIGHQRYLRRLYFAGV